MPFNVIEHANLGYIDRVQKNKLDRLCEAHKRTLKAELEYLIDQTYLMHEMNTPINK